MKHLTLPNDIETIPQLNAFIDGFCEERGIGMDIAVRLNLAIEEAVVNVMNYAYPDGQQGEVRIKAEANDIRLKFVISDDGQPFDPTIHGKVDITQSAEERNIGGLGIHLMRHIMDSINYERVNDQNIFTLRKKLR